MPTKPVPSPFGEADARAEQVMVAMRDRVRLATDLYITKTTPAPVILVRTPYDKSAPDFYGDIARYVLDRGYCLVVQDTRGKVRSEGETFAFTAEMHDGADTIEWIASQSWCDGSVVMFGASYYGFTQWAAAASGHSALKAIAPWITTTEIGTDWMYHQGVFNLETMLMWAADTWVDQAGYEFPDGIDWNHRPLADLVAAIHDGRACPSFDAWRAAPPGDPFWTRGLYGDADPCAIRIPALHSGGWWDVFRRGQMRDYLRTVAGGAPGQHLRFEASDHSDHVLAPDGTPTEDPAPPEAWVPEYLDPALEFYDHYVRGIGAPPPPVRWRLSNAEMQTSETWPPSGSIQMEWFLADADSAPNGPEGGMLLANPERGEAPATWIHDPKNPVPTLGDSWEPLPVLPDERDVESRPDVLTFSSEPSSEPLDLAGAVSASLRVRPAPISSHVMTKLVDVFPDGRARRISDGACLVPGASEGQMISLDMGHTGYRLEPGHRLRLEVAGSHFPRYMVHPGTDDDPWLSEGGAPVEQGIVVGGPAGSRLQLNVLPSR